MTLQRSPEIVVGIWQRWSAMIQVWPSRLLAGDRIPESHSHTDASFLVPHFSQSQPSCPAGLSPTLDAIGQEVSTGLQPKQPAGSLQGQDDGSKAILRQAQQW